MKKFLVLLAVVSFITACGKNDKPKKPDNLIAKDKMENILYDLYIINAAKGVNRKIIEQNGFMPENYVLNKHKIDSAQFADSNSYYSFDTDAYKVMVENVKARLEKEKTELEKVKEEDKVAKKKKDSIQKIAPKKIDTIKGEKFRKSKFLDSTKVL